MTAAEMLVRMLKRQEGFRRIPYWDKTGKEFKNTNRKELGRLTVGYGFELEGRGLSELESSLILSMRVKVLLKKLREYPWFRELNEARQAAIGSMAYQLGFYGLLEFNDMIQALRARDWNGACWQMEHNDKGEKSLWFMQTPSRVRELQTIILEGVYPATVSASL